MKFGNFKPQNFFYIIVPLLSLIVLFLLIRTYPLGQKTVLTMGGQFIQEKDKVDTYNSINLNQSDYDFNEKYFRPSKLPALNTRNFGYKFFENYQNKDVNSLDLPEVLFKSPEETIINYFSVLREADRMTEKRISGCGTIGLSGMPYPVAYDFLSSDYKSKLSYEKFLKSFEGIGHINLIKLSKVSNLINNKNQKFFVEIEVLEGSETGQTHFAYYYEYIYLSNLHNAYKISDISVFGEDFLCAPYHGWTHDAEISVDTRYGNWCHLIKQRYPAQKNGYIKKVYFKGNDNKDYLIEFFILANGTDLEFAQFIRGVSGKWQQISLDPEKCVKNN